MPATGQLIEGGIVEQTQQVFANLKAVLSAGNTSLAQVVRTTVYLTDLSQFSQVNELYAQHFTSDPKPARVTIGVAALPLGANIEMDVIAWVGKTATKR